MALHLSPSPPLSLVFRPRMGEVSSRSRRVRETATNDSRDAAADQAITFEDSHLKKGDAQWRINLPNKYPKCGEKGA